MDRNGKEVNKHYPNREDVYRYALTYQAKDLAPIPLRFQGCVENGDKEIRDRLDSQNETPLISLEEYLKAYVNSPPSDSELRKWFIEDNGNSDRNIGIVAGRASDNLVVIDIVGEDIYKESIEGIKRVLEWRDISTWVIGNGRRFHIYFRIPNAGSEDLRTFTLFRDGDKSIAIRGDNSYIIAPPSIGGDCSEYKPLVDLGTTEIAVIDRDVWRRVVDVLEFIAIPVRIPMDLAKGRNIPRIATVLADEFRRRYYAKYFLVEDIDIGLMCWDGKRYFECEEKSHEFLEHYYRYNELDKYGIRRTALAKEYIYALKHSSHHELRYEGLMISFNNVVLDWERLLDGDLVNAFRPHDPNTIVFHYIPHNLNIDLLNELLKGLEIYARFRGVDSKQFEELANRYTPKTLKAFRDWVGDKWILLYEIIGYTLYPRYVLNKAIMLVGDGSNGKTTYLKLLAKILGSDNVVSVKLQDLVDMNKRFAIASLWHKLANIYDDLPRDVLRNTGEFKVLTGEGRITADRKFREPITFVNYAKLIFSTNELPSVYDTTPAFWRRWIVIKFPNKFPNNPAFFEETFTEKEIENVIVLSILAFYNVYKRKMFSFEESPEDYKEIWLRNANSVYAFIQDIMNIGIDNVIAEKDPDGKVETNHLYSLYTKYCEEQERESLTKAEFTKELERLGYQAITIKGKRYYKGLKLKQREGEQSQSP